MVDVSLNWITTKWNINNAVGNFVWNDVSGNNNANEDVSGTYILKRTDTETSVIIIDGSGDYQDFGIDGSFNSTNPTSTPPVTYQTTMKGKELPISYFNHVTTTAAAYEYTLYHKDLSSNEHQLGTPFTVPYIKYFESPKGLVFRVNKFYGEEENKIEGYFQWNIPTESEFGQKIYDSSNSTIEYLFTTFLSGSEVGTTGDYGTDGISTIGEHYQAITVQSNSTIAEFKYPSFQLQYSAVSEMKYPGGAYEDVAYQLRSIEPYYSYVYSVIKGEVLRKTPDPPQDLTIEIMRYFNTGAKIKISWAAGRGGDYDKHKQLEDGNIAHQELYKDLSNNFINYSVGSTTLDRFNKSFGGLADGVPVLALDQLKNITENSNGRAYITVGVAIGITIIHVHSQSPFKSEKSYASIDIDPAGDWRCSLLPPSGPPDSQSGPLSKNTNKMTTSQKWSALVKGRKFCGRY